MRAPRSTSQVPGAALVLTGACLWGTAGVAVTLGPGDATPWQVGTIRLVVGAALLLAIAGATGTLTSRPRSRAVVVAGAALAAFQLGYFTAIERAGVALGTVVVIGTSPAFAGVIERVWSGVAPERRWWPATGLGVLGLLLLFATGGEAVADAVGIAAGVGAGLAFAAFAVASRRLMTTSGQSAAAMAWLLTASAAVLLPIATVLVAVTDAPLRWTVSGPGLAMLAWLVVAATVVAYWVFGRGLGSVPASTATTLVLAEPLTAAVLGIWLLGERPAPLEALGGFLLVAGLVMLGLRRRRQP